MAIASSMRSIGRSSAGAGDHHHASLTVRAQHRGSAVEDCRDRRSEAKDGGNLGADRDYETQTLQPVALSGSTEHLEFGQRDLPLSVGPGIFPALLDRLF